MTDEKVLALGTARTGERFIREACGALHATIWTVASNLGGEETQQLAQKIANWGRENPNGAVISLGDEPSLIHGLARQKEPTIKSLRGASLAAIVASLDKAYCRRNVTNEFGQLKNTVLYRGDQYVPKITNTEKQPLRVMVKPIGGCASMGITQTYTGEPTPSVPNSPSLLSTLRNDLLPPDNGLEGVIAVVEEYIPPDIPRVSVDGWINEDGTIIPFAISDNCYIEGDPERFCHQLLPTQLSPKASEACWALYHNVVGKLISQFGLRSQFCDVEMFVYDETEYPRAEVMEVNCRIHPNITPIFKNCLHGADVFAAHLSPPDTRPRPRNDHRAAGGLFYLWSSRGGETGRPAQQDIESAENKEDILACVFDTEGPTVNGYTCWGWLYVFAASPTAVREIGHRVRQEIMRE